MFKILTLFLEGKKYGISIDYVTSIEKNVRGITPLPGSNSNIIGVVNVRGEIIPVIDVKKVLTNIDNDVNDDQKLILFSFEEDKGALLVDDTDNIIDISEEQVESTEIDGNETKVANLEDGIFVLLNLEQIRGKLG